MNDLETLSYEEVPLHGKLVAFVTLRQALINVRMIRALTAVCDHLEDSSQADVVVFRGSDGVFCEGMDFADFAPDKPIDIHGFNKWEKIAVRLERLPKATIALVDGPAIGGGFQLALVMDQRIATPRAVFQLPEVHMGFLPGMSTFRLAKYIGLGRARRLMLCAEQV
ncbi:MAG: enoyl-CoA hydratase/isomerase family protein [Pseudomonadota bacterium]